jgi:hypothetical protein
MGIINEQHDRPWTLFDELEELAIATFPIAIRLFPEVHQ